LTWKSAPLCGRWRQIIRGLWPTGRPGSWPRKSWKPSRKNSKVGLSTNYLVLQYQRDLANSLTMELKALIDYNISLANLDRVMGTGRERRQVSVINPDLDTGL